MLPDRGKFTIDKLYDFKLRYKLAYTFKKQSVHYFTYSFTVTSNTTRRHEAYQCRRHVESTNYNYYELASTNRKQYSQNYNNNYQIIKK